MCCVCILVVCWVTASSGIWSQLFSDVGVCWWVGLGFRVMLGWGFGCIRAFSFGACVRVSGLALVRYLRSVGIDLATDVVVLCV